MSPRVQDAYHAQVHACFACKNMKGLPCRFKQCIVNHSRLLQCKAIELLWQRKHQMKIRAGQKVCFPPLSPLFSFVSLTFRTVPVATTVVADADVAAAITCIYMSAQSRCATIFEGTQCFLLMYIKALQICVAQYISYLPAGLQSAKILSNGLTGNCSGSVHTCRYSRVVSILA